MAWIEPGRSRHVECGAPIRTPGAPSADSGPDPGHGRPWLAICLLAAACAGPGVEHTGDPSVGADFGISPTPPMVGTAQVWVEVTDGGGPAADGTRVWVAAVPEGGAAREETPLRAESGGRWSGDLDFPRPGPGRLHVRIVLPDDRTATLRFPITVSRRPGSPGPGGP